MAQWLRVLAVLPEVPSSVPSAYTVCSQSWVTPPPETLMSFSGSAGSQTQVAYTHTSHNIVSFCIWVQQFLPVVPVLVRLREEKGFQATSGYKASSGSTGVN